MLQQTVTVLSDESVLHSVFGTKMSVTGLGVWMMDSVNLGKKQYIDFLMQRMFQ
jgi:hypothetical protein